MAWHELIYLFMFHWSGHDIKTSILLLNGLKDFDRVVYSHALKKKITRTQSSMYRDYNTPKCQIFHFIWSMLYATLEHVLLYITVLWEYCVIQTCTAWVKWIVSIWLETWSMFGWWELCKHSLAELSWKEVVPFHAASILLFTLSEFQVSIHAQL